MQVRQTEDAAPRPRPQSWEKTVQPKKTASNLRPLLRDHSFWLDSLEQPWSRLEGGKGRRHLKDLEVYMINSRGVRLTGWELWSLSGSQGKLAHSKANLGVLLC